MLDIFHHIHICPLYIDPEMWWDQTLKAMNVRWAQLQSNLNSWSF